MNDTYLIPKQLKSLSSRDAKILSLLGIDFSEFSPSEHEQNILIADVDMPIRAINVLKLIFEYEGVDIKNMTISDFVAEFSERRLLRYRNCGSKTIREINNAIYPYGFKLSKGRYY